MRRSLLAVTVLVAAPVVLTSNLGEPNAAGASGPEFQVSSPSTSPRYSYAYRFGPGADMADTGDFLVVWATTGAGGLGEMAGRAFDANGDPRADPFDLGYGALFHYFPESPDVAASDGGFVGVWTGYGGPSAYYTVQSQRFSLQGDVEGPRTIASPPSSYRAEVSAEPGGDFIVVWDTPGSAVSLRRFEDTGEPSWPEQTFPAGQNALPDPDVAVDASGNFTVVWSQSGLSGPKGIQAKRFDRSGFPLGLTIEVSEPAPAARYEPAVATLPGGGFVSVWTSPVGDGSYSAVYGRVFDASGQPAGGEFLVNTTTTGVQQYPDVSADDRGNFLVVWQSGPTNWPGNQVLGRWFDRSGLPLGGEFQVNQDLTTGQQLPTVAMRDDGESVVAWFSRTTPGGTLPSIRARRYCAIPNLTDPVDATVCEGDTATLSAAVTGREPFDVRWMTGGAPLQDSGRFSGSGTPTLVITSVQVEDTGLYLLDVVDGCPEPQRASSSPAQLSVEPAPAEVADLVVAPEGGGSMLRLTWAAAAGASDYVVRSDLAPDGGFATVEGFTSDPATGILLPASGDTLFFLVAARTPVCGEGPLR